MNRLFLKGNLGKTPEIKDSSSGMVARTSIAVKGYKDTTDWFNVTAFGKTADLMAKYLQKGSEVMLECHLKQNTYEKDGKKYSSVEIIVDNVEFCGKASKEEKQNDFTDIPVEDEGLPFC